VIVVRRSSFVVRQPIPTIRGSLSVFRPQASRSGIRIPIPQLECLDGIRGTTETSRSGRIGLDSERLAGWAGPVCTRGTLLVLGCDGSGSGLGFDAMCASSEEIRASCGERGGSDGHDISVETPTSCHMTDFELSFLPRSKKNQRN
jgi:hypothetical protein